MVFVIESQLKLYLKLEKADKNNELTKKSSK
jgi:hypothetical protein